MRQVLQRLLKNHLYVKPEKCEFHVTDVAFPGFIIKQGQVLMDSKKTQAVRDWPVPKTVKEVQQFLGFAKRRFIRGFSSVAAPISALTKKDSILLDGILMQTRHSEDSRSASFWLLY